MKTRPLTLLGGGGAGVFSDVDILSGGALDLYNTTPISSTDFERLRADWSSNVARIWTQNDGTGTGRDLRVGAGVVDAATGPRWYTTWSGALPAISHASSAATGSAGLYHELASFSLIGSAGTQTAVAVSPTFAQTSTAAGIALLVNPSGTFGSGGGLLQEWQLAGAIRGRIDTNGTMWAAANINTSGVGWTTGIGGAADILLVRDAADTLAQRRSTNAQTFRVYNTYTDGSNYERLNLVATAGACEIFTSQAGTGSSRRLGLGINGAAQWQVATTGNFTTIADNTYDIGASGATRPRNVYVGTSIVTGTAATLHTTSTALTDYAGASSTGPFTNSPVAGNPTKWIAINDNGTTRYIPTW